MPPTIFSYIKAEESRFDTEEVQVGENWFWNFKKHVQLLFHLKNGVFYTGENNWVRPFKNIMQPILSLAYWTEDIEVKDVVFFLEGEDDKALSFILKKYHDEVYTREHDLDTMLDEITESDIDYGGVLVQQGKERPEVLVLNNVAFCDQTDILGGVISFKYNFSAAKLRSMKNSGWGKPENGADISIDDLIVLATAEQSSIGSQSNKGNTSTSKSIEVYITRGNMPEAYLKDNHNMEDYVNQIQINAFYTNKDGNRVGVTLYAKEDAGKSLKFHTSKKVFQRALGQGVGETLLNPQISTNFLTIHKTNMLEAGSKIALYTDDPAYTQKNKIQDMENLEVTTIEDGKKINVVPTIEPAKVQLFGNEINEWYLFAQNAGAANDPLMGKEAPSGTTFKGQERSVAQGRGPHDRRRGQRAKFVEEIYRDWLIDDMIKEITGGKKFLATLSTDELSWIADTIATNEANKKTVEAILNHGPMTPEAQAALMDFNKKIFLKKGNKHLVEAIKGEFEGFSKRVGISVANKQKNLADLSDKLLSIFQFVFANPQGFMQAMQIPALAKSFENILEFGGMSIGDFSSLLKPAEQPTQPTTPQTFTPTTQIAPPSARVPQLGLK